MRISTDIVGIIAHLAYLETFCQEFVLVCRQQSDLKTPNISAAPDHLHAHVQDARKYL